MHSQLTNTLRPCLSCHIPRLARHDSRLAHTLARSNIQIYRTGMTFERHQDQLPLDRLHK